MKPIRFFRHEDWIQPGRLDAYLASRDVPWEIVCIDRGDPIPQRVDDVSGLVFLGGTMSVNDAFPWLEEEMRLIRMAADRQVPMLGHCMGSQLIAKALGGDVGPMATKEIGWYEIHKHDNPVAQEWLKEVPDRSDDSDLAPRSLHLASRRHAALLERILRGASLCAGQHRGDGGAPRGDAGNA